MGCNNGCSGSGSNCGCGCQDNTGDLKYDGQDFVCQNADEDILFQIPAGEPLNNILNIIFNQLCSLLNTDFSDFQGSVWYSDSGAPAPDLGDVNDFYLRSSNGDVYKKEDPASWGSPITNLKGTAGSDGSNGNSFRFGTGVPSPALGISGDSYVDLGSADLDLYTKTGAVWTDTGLKVKGIAGADGADGANGADGTNGTDGDDGLSFRQGVGVPLVSLGIDGDSYLDSANGDIYLKATGSWSVTGNIYSGPTGLEFLFNAEKITPQSIINENATLQLSFADDVSPGRFDYGNTWTSDQQKLPADTDNLSYRGTLDLKVTGVDGGSDNDVTVTVYRNAVVMGTFTIPVPAGTADDTVIPFNFATANAFYSEDDIVKVELSTPNDPVYATFVGEVEAGAVFYNVQS